MILAHSNDVESTEDEGFDFGIDDESMGIFFKGFSDNLYSNKIGSIVREIASNCFDAHAELGTDQDVHIYLKAPDVFMNEPGKVSFRDFGIGLSPDRMKNVYGKYFASTKRDTNGQIGGFGIGAKSPLAYTDIFEVVTIVDGIKYHYMVHKGVKKPKIDLIGKETTDEPRGTEVIIPIREKKDYQKFVTEIRSQLRYFEGIKYFGGDIESDYKIIKGKNFIVSSKDASENSKTIGLCIGKVHYPLDFDLVFGETNLRQFDARTGLSLYFDIGELSVTMNRESVEYKDDAIKLIRERYDLAKAEILELKFKKDRETTDLIEYINNVSANNVLHIDALEKGIQLPRDFDDDSKAGWNIPQFEGFEYIKKPSKNLFDDFIKISHFYDGNIVHKKTAKISRVRLFQTFYETVRDGDNSKMTIYRSKGVVNKKKLDYLKDICPTQQFIIVKLDKRGPDEFYDDSPAVVKDSSSFWLSDLAPEKEQVFHKELKTYSNYVMKYFIKNTTSFDNLEISDEWDADYKARNGSKKVSKAFITIRKTYNGNYFTKYSYRSDKLTDIFNKYALQIYAFQGEEHLMRSACHEFSNHGFKEDDGKSLGFFKVSRDNARKHIVTQFPNAYHVSELDQIPALVERQRAKKALGYFEDMVEYEFCEISSIFKTASRRSMLKTTNKMRSALATALSLSKHHYGTKGLFTYNSLGKDDSGKEMFEIIDLGTQVNLTELLYTLEEYRKANPLLFRLIQNVHFDEGTEEFDFFKKSLNQNFKPFNINL